jgi:hypothetical protein
VSPPLLLPPVSSVASEPPSELFGGLLLLLLPHPTAAAVNPRPAMARASKIRLCMGALLSFVE